MVQDRKRAPKGSVYIKNNNGWLLLRWTYRGQSFSLSLAMQYTKENLKLAKAKAKLIESDIIYEKFDSTLEKYKPPKLTLTLVPTPLVVTPDLGEIWQKYLEYRKPLVAETTYKLNYARVTSHIEKLVTKNLKDAAQIRATLLDRNSSYTAKRILTQLNAACRWAFKARFIESNPFDGMAGEIKVTNDEDRDIDPFSKEERDAIIQAFEEHPTYYHYAPFVKFLFLTGCRTSEAVALKWKHIDSQFRFINFCEATVSVSSSKIHKGTKTGKSRKFPINKQLRELLESIQPERCTEDTLVFPSLTGREINSHTFGAMCWKGTTIRGKYILGIVTKLVEEGKVQRYRPQYNSRHTFITMALESGISVSQIAKWVGNSPEIIMTHYAGVLDFVQPPEI